MLGPGSRLGEREWFSRLVTMLVVNDKEWPQRLKGKGRAWKAL